MKRKIIRSTDEDGILNYLNTRGNISVEVSKDEMLFGSYCVIIVDNDRQLDSIIAKTLDVKVINPHDILLLADKDEEEMFTSFLHDFTEMFEDEMLSDKRIIDLDRIFKDLEETMIMKAEEVIENRKIELAKLKNDLNEAIKV